MSPKPLATATPARSAATAVLDSTETADRHAFEAALAADFPTQKRPEEGEVVSGLIAGITPDLVLVAIGGKSEALMDLAELDGEVVGDRIEAVVIKASPDIRISRRLAASRRAKAELKAAFAAKIPVAGRVMSRNKGGFEIAIGGATGPRAFCPVSQIDIGRHDEASLATFIGQSHDFQIIEYLEEGRRVVVSRAALLRQAQEESAAKARESLHVGAVVNGKVRSLTDFGAFVDLGGLDGLVHVTEISHKRVAHAKDLLHVGQEVSVKVTKIEQDGKRISLSMKELEKDPWDGLKERYAPGTPFHGKIVRHADFGLFIELEPGVDGLIHVSQLPPGLDRKDPSLAISESVNGWVRELDPSARRLSLTLREIVTKDPWETIAGRLAEGEVVPGVVENVATFGVFVRLDAGLTGLIPNSETGLPRGAVASKSFTPGKKVDVKVTSVDTARKRVSLAIPVATDEADRADVKKFREETAKREKVEPEAVSGFGASLLAALSGPRKNQKSVLKSAR